MRAYKILGYRVNIKVTGTKHTMACYYNANVEFSRNFITSTLISTIEISYTMKSTLSRVVKYVPISLTNIAKLGLN